MNLDKLLRLVSHLFFLGAFVLVVFAIAEGVANLFDYTITRGVYSGGRFLEFAAVFLTFVIATILRELQKDLRNRLK